MSLMTAIEVSASGLTAQRRRLEALMSNLVNANTTQPPGKEVYRRQDVLFTAAPPARSFGGAFDEAMSAVAGVEVSDVVTDRGEPMKRYEPGHPHADKDGYVSYPNVNPLIEMTDMRDAQRSYEANLNIISATRRMMPCTS